MIYIDLGPGKRLDSKPLCQRGVDGCPLDRSILWIDLKAGFKYGLSTSIYKHQYCKIGGLDFKLYASIKSRPLVHTVCVVSTSLGKLKEPRKRGRIS